MEKNSKSKIKKIEAGIRCPRCGCADLRMSDGRPWEIVNTIRLPNAIRRYRICRYCGRKIRTREMVEN